MDKLKRSEFDLTDLGGNNYGGPINNNLKGKSGQDRNLFSFCLFYKISSSRICFAGYFGFIKTGGADWPGTMRSGDAVRPHNAWSARSRR